MSNDAMAKSYAAGISSHQTEVQSRSLENTSKNEVTKYRSMNYSASLAMYTATQQANMAYYNAAGTIGVENAKIQTSALIE